MAKVTGPEKNVPGGAKERCRVLLSLRVVDYPNLRL